MLRRDLLMDEIQKLARAMARIMGLKQQGKNEEAMKEVDQELDSLHQRKASEIALLSNEELLSDFPDDGSRAETANAIGELLFYYGQAELEKGNTKTAHSVFQKVILLWDHAEPFMRSVMFDRTVKRRFISDLMDQE